MKQFLKKNWLLIISLLYLLWPLDIVSDLLGPLGLIDDGGLLFLAILNAIYRYFKDKKDPQAKQ